MEETDVKRIQYFIALQVTVRRLLNSADRLEKIGLFLCKTHQTVCVCIKTSRTTGAVFTAAADVLFELEAF